MINTFFLVGQLKKVQVSTPKDASKSPSAVLFVQYGPVREYTGGNVEFINAATVRVPSYRYPSVKDSLVEGATVQITGHFQGVLKAVMGESHVANELVVDRIIVEGSARQAAPVAQAAPEPVVG